MQSPLAQRLVQQGVEAFQCGRRAEAEAAYLQALVINPNCLDAHLALANLRLPGEDYLGVISRIHETLRPKTYVEIGVNTGRSIVRALATTRCIGIDPEPKIKVQLQPQTTIYALTSDAFFATCDLRAILGGQSVELAFVDGLHVFENALADFINLEKYCAPGGTIMLHDCVPLDAATATRECETSFWTGDTWRVLPTLAHFRPDLSITVIASPPSGLAIVRGLDPDSEILRRKMDEAVAYGSDLDFSTTQTISTLGIEILPSDGNAVSRLFA